MPQELTPERTWSRKCGTLGLLLSSVSVLGLFAISLQSMLGGLNAGRGPLQNTIFLGLVVLVFAGWNHS